MSYFSFSINLNNDGKHRIWGREKEGGVYRQTQVATVQTQRVELVMFQSDDMVSSWRAITRKE